MKESKNCKLTPDRNVFHTVDILLATTLSPCSLEMSMDNLCCHPRSVVPFSLAPEKSQRIEKKSRTGQREKCSSGNLIKKKNIRNM